VTSDQKAQEELAASGAAPAGSTAAADVATWSVVLIALFSVTIRPFVETTGLPSFMVNLDALLVPVASLAVAVVGALTWGSVSRGRRLLTLAVAVTAVLLLLSWVTAETRSLASLALGASMVLLLPLGLYLVVMATGAREREIVRSTLCLLVLLQLAVGVLQYVALQVAQKAPTGADLVDGTTSHNFWPVFALPASMALVVTGRGASRYLWPGSVALLAVYAEAKAALIVWLPIIAVVLVLDLVQPDGNRPAPGRTAARPSRSVPPSPPSSRSGSGGRRRSRAPGRCSSAIPRSSSSSPSATGPPPPRPSGMVPRPSRTS
jgi:hypothetical protein